MTTDAEVEIEHLKLSLVETLLDELVGQPYPDGHALVERLAEIMGHSSVEGWLRNEFRKTLDRLMLGGDGEPPRLQGILASDD